MNRYTHTADIGIDMDIERCRCRYVVNRYTQTTYTYTYIDEFLNAYRKWWSSCHVPFCIFNLWEATWKSVPVPGGLSGLRPAEQEAAESSTSATTTGRPTELQLASLKM